MSYKKYEPYLSECNDIGVQIIGALNFLKSQDKLSMTADEFISRFKESDIKFILRLSEGVLHYNYQDRDITKEQLKYFENLLAALSINSFLNKIIELFYSKDLKEKIEKIMGQGYSISLIDPNKTMDERVTNSFNLSFINRAKLEEMNLEIIDSTFDFVAEFEKLEKILEGLKNYRPDWMTPQIKGLIQKAVEDTTFKLSSIYSPCFEDFAKYILTPKGVYGKSETGNIGKVDLITINNLDEAVISYTKTYWQEIKNSVSDNIDISNMDDVCFNPIPINNYNEFIRYFQFPEFHYFLTQRKCKILINNGNQGYDWDVVDCYSVKNLRETLNLTLKEVFFNLMESWYTLNGISKKYPDNVPLNEVVDICNKIKIKILTTGYTFSPLEKDLGGDSPLSLIDVVFYDPESTKAGTISVQKVFEKVSNKSIEQFKSKIFTASDVADTKKIGSLYVFNSANLEGEGPKNSNKSTYFRGLYSLNPDKMASEILFAYKKYNTMAESGVPFTPRVLIGRNEETMAPVYLELQNQANIVNAIIAGSGSGKGVLTLAILANIMIAGNSVIYADFKPDMAAALWDMSRTAGVPIYSTDGKGTRDGNGIVPYVNPEKNIGVFYNNRYLEPSDWAGYDSNEYFGASLPIDALNLIPYLKSIELFAALGVARIDCDTAILESIGDNPDEKAFIILDEAQMANTIYNNTLIAVNKYIKEHKKDTGEKEQKIYKAFEKFSRVFDSGLAADIKDIVITTGRVAGLSFIMLGQQVDPGQWKTCQGTWTDSTFGYMMGNAATKLIGKNPGRSVKYGIPQQFQDDPFIGKKMGYWALCNQADSKTDTSAKAVKTYLILNKNDFNVQNPSKSGTFTRKMMNSNPSLKEDLMKDFTADDGVSAREEVGFEGMLTKYMSQEDYLRNITKTYQIYNNFLIKAGIVGEDKQYKNLESYLYSANPDSFYNAKQLVQLLKQDDTRVAPDGFEWVPIESLDKYFIPYMIDRKSKKKVYERLNSDIKIDINTISSGGGVVATVNNVEKLLKNTAVIDKKFEEILEEFKKDKKTSEEELKAVEEALNKNNLPFSLNGIVIETEEELKDKLNALKGYIIDLDNSIANINTLKDKDIYLLESLRKYCLDEGIIELPLEFLVPIADFDDTSAPVNNTKNNYTVNLGDLRKLTNLNFILGLSDELNKKTKDFTGKNAERAEGAKSSLTVYINKIVEENLAENKKLAEEQNANPENIKIYLRELDDIYKNVLLYLETKLKNAYSSQTIYEFNLQKVQSDINILKNNGMPDIVGVQPAPSENPIVENNPENSSAGVGDTPINSGFTPPTSSNKPINSPPPQSSGNSVIEERVNELIEDYRNKLNTVLTAPYNDVVSLRNMARTEANKSKFNKDRDISLYKFQKGKYVEDKSNFFKKMETEIIVQEVRDRVKSVIFQEYTETLRQYELEIKNMSFDVDSTGTQGGSQGGSQGGPPAKKDPPKTPNQYAGQRLTAPISTGNLEFDLDEYENEGSRGPLKDSKNVKVAMQLVQLITKDIKRQFGGSGEIQDITITAGGGLVLNGFAYMPQFDDALVQSMPQTKQIYYQNGDLAKVVNIGAVVDNIMDNVFMLSIESPSVANSEVFQNEIGIKNYNYSKLFRRMSNLQTIILPDGELTRNGPQEVGQTGLGLGAKLAGIFGFGKGKKDSQGYVPNPSPTSNRDSMTDRIFESKPVKVMAGALGWTLGCKAVVMAATIFGPWGLLFGAFAAAGAYKEIKNGNNQRNSQSQRRDNRSGGQNRNNQGRNNQGRNQNKQNKQGNGGFSQNYSSQGRPPRNNNNDEDWY